MRAAITVAITTPRSIHHMSIPFLLLLRCSLSAKMRQLDRGGYQYDDKQHGQNQHGHRQQHPHRRLATFLDDVQLLAFAHRLGVRSERLAERQALLVGRAHPTRDVAVTRSGDASITSARGANFPARISDGFAIRIVVDSVTTAGSRPNVGGYSNKDQRLPAPWPLQPMRTPRNRI